MKTLDAVKQKRIVDYAHKLIGIQEQPLGSHSNDGPDVHRLQESTGAFGAPWCVSTGQNIAIQVYGHTLADRTANAYYFGQYAHDHGWVVPRPTMGAFVVYHIGQGHFGTVVEVHPNGTFDAIEGNEGDAVRLMHRDPRVIQCTFIVPPELYAQEPEFKTIEGVRYYTFHKDVPKQENWATRFAEGKGYYSIHDPAVIGPGMVGVHERKDKA